MEIYPNKGRITKKMAVFLSRCSWHEICTKLIDLNKNVEKLHTFIDI
jgi:hypothetical protein